MRTNIDIDDELMATALEAGPYKTKKEAVEAGLKLLARQAAYREVLKWRGKRRQARRLMTTLSIEPAGGAELAQAAAQPYRSLRAPGITVRSAVDVLAATFCIDHDYALLHGERDFDGFEAHRGLRTWRP